MIETNEWQKKIIVIFSLFLWCCCFVVFSYFESFKINKTYFSVHRIRTIGLQCLILMIREFQFCCTIQHCTLFFVLWADNLSHTHKKKNLLNRQNCYRKRENFGSAASHWLELKVFRKRAWKHTPNAIGIEFQRSANFDNHIFGHFDDLSTNNKRIRVCYELVKSIFDASINWIVENWTKCWNVQLFQQLRNDKMNTNEKRNATTTPLHKKKYPVWVTMPAISIEYQRAPRRIT